MQRWGYRVAYAGLRVYWRVFHPRVSGVKCILTHGDEVLLVPGSERVRLHDAIQYHPRSNG